MVVIPFLYCIYIIAHVSGKVKRFLKKSLFFFILFFVKGWIIPALGHVGEFDQPPT